MPVSSSQFYSSWKETFAEAANMASDTFKVLLMASGYAWNPSSHSLLSDITNEVSGSGYSRQTLANVVSSQSSGVYMFDADNPVFIASGGSIVARYWAIFDDTLAGDPLVLCGLLDENNEDVTIPDGKSLILQWSENGIIRMV